MRALYRILFAFNRIDVTRKMLHSTFTGTEIVAKWAFPPNRSMNQSVGFYEKQPPHFLDLNSDPILQKDLVIFCHK